MNIKFILAAFTLAFGLEIRGEIIRGYPCIKRLNQLYCPTPGNSYPNTNTTDHGGRSKRERRVKREKIDLFIDENKALIRRMFGEYNDPPEDNATPPFTRDQYETYDGHTVRTRFERSRASYPSSSSSNKIDACESSVEIVTPYWASNSAGKIRAIVNTQHLQQAIQQEVCQKSSSYKPRPSANDGATTTASGRMDPQHQSGSVQTKRCNGDCSCEQKYKWHRLLAYDPDDDCKGIFMDWFLFPSCCVCRCTNTITPK